MIDIACLILGIVGLVKGRISVTKRRELRGAPMYVVASLLCLPLPLSFLAGAALAAMNGGPVDQHSIFKVVVFTDFGPILLAIILGIAFSKPKDDPAQQPRPQGFEVKM